MLTNIIRSTLALALTLSLPTLATIQTPEESPISEPLSLYLWEDSISPKVTKDWENTAGQKIELSHFDNDDDRNQLMLNGQSLPFDIVVLDNVSAQIYGETDSLVRLDTLPNYNNNDAKWNQACGPYSIPYFWGILGIAYRQSKLAEAPTSWSILALPPNELKGHISLLNDTVETLLPSLYSLGLDPKTESPKDLKAAFSQIARNHKNILTFEYPISYVRSHPNSDKLHVAMVYSGDQYSLNEYEKDGDWAFTVPKEGTSIWVDCLAINKYSNHIDSAKDFLNYLLQADVAADNALHVMAATTNSVALKSMPKHYTQDKTLFPSQEIISNSVIDSALTQKNISLRTKIIHNIISNHEAQY